MCHHLEAGRRAKAATYQQPVITCSYTSQSHVAAQNLLKFRMTGVGQSYIITVSANCCHVFQRMTLESPWHSGSERRPSWAVWHTESAHYILLSLRLFFRFFSPYENGLTRLDQALVVDSWHAFWQFRPSWFPVSLIVSYCFRKKIQCTGVVGTSTCVQLQRWTVKAIRLPWCLQKSASINSRCKRLRGRSATIYDHLCMTCC